MCESVRFPDGSFAIVCGMKRGRRLSCGHCGKSAAFECDGPPRSSSSKTCDRPICSTCRIHVPPAKDFCREHRAEARAAAAQLRLSFDAHATA